MNAKKIIDSKTFLRNLEVAFKHFSQDNWRSQASSTGNKKRAVVAAIFTKDSNDERLKLLYIRRAVNNPDFWSGHIAFPGGKVDEITDSCELDTAIRETNEEIGIDLTLSKCLGRLPTDRNAAMNVEVGTFVFLGENILPECTRLNRDEVSDVLLIDVDELLEQQQESFYLLNAMFPSLNLPKPPKTLFSQMTSEELKNPRDFKDFVLWGLTYRITSDLLILGGHEGFPQSPWFTRLLVPFARGAAMVLRFVRSRI